MNSKGLLDVGVSEIYARSTGQLIGYAFTEPNGSGFFERWLLFTNPRNDFEVRPASKTMTSWSLENWQEKVPELWQPNAYYVWAQADAYQYGETYGGVTWTKIPPSTGLPPASFPELPGVSFQLDYSDCSIVSVMQNEICGSGYVLDGLSHKSSVEYWLLPAAYVPAGRSSAGIAPSGNLNSCNHSTESLDNFLALANENWNAGATFSITGCINYQGKSPPLFP